MLYHPDLRPLVSYLIPLLNITMFWLIDLFQEGNDLYEDTLEPKYISADLTEVELVENETGPRENHTLLLDVRQTF